MFPAMVNEESKACSGRAGMTEFGASLGCAYYIDREGIEITELGLLQKMVGH